MSLKIESMSSDESRDFIASFLNTHPSGVLATSDREALPHAAVVYFELHQDFTLTFATKTETQKYRNIEQNKQVAFAVYDEKDQTAVQIIGRVEAIDDNDEHLEVLDYMYNLSPKLSMPMVPPVARLNAGEYVAFRLLPSEIKMAIYSRPDEERDDIYETMTFSEQSQVA